MNLSFFALLAISLASHLQPSLSAGEQANSNPNANADANANVGGSSNVDAKANAGGSSNVDANAKVSGSPSVDASAKVDTSLNASGSLNLDFCISKSSISVQLSSGMSDDDSCKCTGKSVDSSPQAGYTNVPGMGSYKLHTKAANWEDARKSCVEEKAQLAVINSKAEEKVLISMLKSNADNLQGAKTNKVGYLGLHDFFKKGDWVTVTGENFKDTGYTEWSKTWYGGQPDGNGHCATLVTEGGGMDDVVCSRKFAYFCEMPPADCKGPGTSV